MAFTFVGGSYALDSRTADVQRAVNCYPAPIESMTGKAGFMLKSIPGLVRFASIGSVGRGAYEINGRAWVVVDSGLYEVFADGTFAARGTLNTSTGPVGITSNTTQLIVTDGGGYTLTLAGHVFERITDEDFPGSAMVDYLDQYAIFSPASGQQFWISDLGDASSVDGLDFSSAESSPDDIVGFKVINRDLWLIGRDGGEVWFNTSNSEFPIERNNGSVFGVGCSAKWTIQPYNNSIAWLGADKSGGPGVWMAAGYQVARISNRGVEKAIAACTDIGSATAYTQRIDGSVFYCLNLPGVSTTQCYDILTGAWHERAELIEGEYAQHRVGWYFNAFGLDLGLGTDGVVYRWSRTAYDNDGDRLVRDRISPHNATPTQDLLQFSDFQLDLDTGFAGDVMLRYSNDGGYTWGPWDVRNMGGTGSVATRLRWLRCGQARDRVWHVRCTDSRKFDIVNATVRVAR
jgi:hypothetical protein